MSVPPIMNVSSMLTTPRLMLFVSVMTVLIRKVPSTDSNLLKMLKKPKNSPACRLSGIALPK